MVILQGWYRTARQMVLKRGKREDAFDRRRARRQHIMVHARPPDAFLGARHLLAGTTGQLAALDLLQPLDNLRRPAERVTELEPLAQGKIGDRSRARLAFVARLEPRQVPRAKGARQVAGAAIDRTEVRQQGRAPGALR